MLATVIAAAAATAQPADRPAAFQAAISSALAQAPGYALSEAALENDGGQWKFEVQAVAANGQTLLEFELDAGSLAVLRSRNKSISSSKVAQLQATLAAFGSATITTQQAFARMAARAPAGVPLVQVETGVEGGHATYKFDFSDGTTSQRVNIDAQTGNPAVPGGGSPSSGNIALDLAIAIAENAYPGCRTLEAAFEADDHRWEIKLITAAGVARKLRIAAVGGAILSDDVFLRGRERAADDRLRIGNLSGGSLTLSTAMQNAIAVAGAANWEAVKAEYEFEHGVLLAKITVEDSFGPRSVFLNADTGAVVTPPVPDAAPATPPAPVIDIAGAASAARTASPGAAVLNVEMELKGGRQFYKVKTLTLTTPLRLRELVVDGKTGVVWSSTLLPMSATYLPTARQIVQLLPTATKTFANAQTIALATLADGQIQSIELEAEQGTFLAYNVDVLVGTKLFSLVIDSRTGAVRPK